MTLKELKDKLEKVEMRLKEYTGYSDILGKMTRIDELNEKMSISTFWNDNLEANKAVEELKRLKAELGPWQDYQKRLKELRELTDLSQEEADFFVQINQDLDRLIEDIAQLEVKTLLSYEFDKDSAILSINAGAGGTESCDWANMLLRMYTRWAEGKGYKVKIIDILPGEEAGIKNVTLLIEGDYAYGYLRSERGVHRLVRISPFDANKRRHTSFTSVDVIPEIEDEVNVEIEERDLRVDTFRASGPGGQHMQKSDSAVRITHLPTGIVVACQNERSQYQNRQTAIKILKARLYELKRREQEEKLSRQHSQKQKIEWGSQIRSYVIHPYNMVKDHRTDYETGNVDAVMDGKLDDFIEAYLKNQKPKLK